MRRLMPLISAFMLVLTLWTGSAAHAAEALECGDATAAAAGHFDGDDDEVPADSGKAAPHHHNICHGHCLGVPNEGDVIGTSRIAEGLKFAPPQDFYKGLPPDAALRPPMA